MRIAPKVWIGLAIWIGYVVVVTAIQLLSGIPYPELSASASNVWRAIVVSLSIGSILLAATAWWLGWWKPALRDRHRAPHKWPIIAPLVLLLAALVNFAGTDWSKFDAGFLLALLTFGVLVGFAEEFSTRGLVLVALRSKLGEGWVWFLSSLMFGLMHAVNFFAGQALSPTLTQVVLTFALGTGFYILRRTTGTLLWAMALHAIWDISTFTVAYAPTELAGLAGPIQYLSAILAVAFVYWAIKGANERTAVTTPDPALR
ncbi:CPBP family intramembrane glutamic endopeptidase [Paenarthrobacter sp. A20]|uniref:CPBP family intramembrane glutamic endopeptidase n=1 Tax=Paenarthrobacter sp. A20 TaxID=2817891 RepID=UPI0020A1A583|nr:CPBP family intramembrane glutamic endopeptidase [Paenarthrobacter sp. A20]MCP1415240.1 membrane protease YdiL (CAAX protease family) [Paenarthrobacter sp. A20]